MADMIFNLKLLNEKTFFLNFFTSNHLFCLFIFSTQLQFMKKAKGYELVIIFYN